MPRKITDACIACGTCQANCPVDCIKEGDIYSIDADSGIKEIGERPEAIYHGQSYWGVGHSILIDNYYDCLKNNKNFEIDAFEGSDAEKIVFAAYESSKTGESVDL